MSPATQSLTIGVDGATPTTVDLSSASPNCNVPGPLDELTCTASLTVSPGSHAFVLTAYDAPGGTGQRLSENSITAKIVADTANVLAVTLAGIPVAMQAVPLPQSSDLSGNETAGFALLRGATQSFNATSLDADGNYIVGPGAPTVSAALRNASGGSSMTVTAASNGNPNQFALSSSGFGSATLVLTATPASSSAGPAEIVSVPVSSTTIASVFSGTVGTNGTVDGSATTATFASPNGTAYDPVNGNLYVTDQGSTSSVPVGCSVRQISPSGAVSTLAGNPAACGFVDGTGSRAEFTYPNGIAYDPVTNDLYVTDTNSCSIRQVTLQGVVTTIAGSFANTANSGEALCGNQDGPGAVAQLDTPIGIAYDASDQNLYFVDSTNCTVRQMTASGTVKTIAGSCADYTDGTGTAASFNIPTGIAVDSGNGNLEVTDTGNCLIRQVTTAGVVTTIAGNPPTAQLPSPENCGFVDGSGAAAQIGRAEGLAYDTKDGTLYVTDSSNCAIREVTLDGVVTTVSGSPPATCSFMNGFGARARFDGPGLPVYVAANDSLYFTDYFSDVIRQVQL